MSGSSSTLCTLRSVSSSSTFTSANTFPGPTRGSRMFSIFLRADRSSIRRRSARPLAISVSESPSDEACSTRRSASRISTRSGRRRGTAAATRAAMRLPSSWVMLEPFFSSTCTDALGSSWSSTKRLRCAMERMTSLPSTWAKALIWPSIWASMQCTHSTCSTNCVTPNLPSPSVHGPLPSLSWSTVPRSRRATESRALRGT